MTWISELDLDKVKVNQHAKYLDQRSFNSKAIVQTDRHNGLTAPPGPLNWLVKIRGSQALPSARCPTHTAKVFSGTQEWHLALKNLLLLSTKPLFWST